MTSLDFFTLRELLDQLDELARRRKVTLSDRRRIDDLIPLIDRLEKQQ